MTTAQTYTLGTIEVALNPGDFHFHRPVPGATPPARLTTLLGSCVSIILWHPELRLAGMSHAVLPSRSRRSEVADLDGRFCDESVALFRQELTRAGARPQHFHVYLVGGGQMYLTQNPAQAIGDRNIEVARTCLKAAGFLIRAEHVGQAGYRKVELDMMRGEVTVTYSSKRINLSTARPASNIC